jgi:MoaA/NifB/PqqE/SkfB family radical SAM enzyme
MHLDPTGTVRACCQNVWHHLGKVGDRSLQDIWSGAPRRRLQDRLRASDYSLGCESCGEAALLGRDSTVYARVFDHLQPKHPEDEWPRQLELALSNACNLQCVMCNGELSSAIRVRREGRAPLPLVYDDAFFEQLAPFLEHVEFVTFLGGEPFLGAEPLRVMSMLADRGSPARCHINTNGTQWTPRIEALIRSLPFHVAVSIDGASASVVESIRVGVDFDSLRRNIYAIRAACAAAGNSFALTFCLMTDNLHELRDVLKWGDRLDCDVVINQVTHPPRFSLARLSTADLGALLDSLRSLERSDSQPLTRNHAVWDRTLDLLANMMAARILRNPRSTADEGRAERFVRDRRPRAVIEMTVGHDQLIESIAPDLLERPPIPLISLVGQPSIQLMSTLGPLLGSLEHSSIESNQIETRRFTYIGPLGRTCVSTAMTVRDGKEFWRIGIEDDPSDPSAGKEPSSATL